MSSQNFGQMIHAQRRLLGLTRREIARKIKTSTPYLSHLETGKRHPSDKVLRRLAQALSIDYRTLHLIVNLKAEHN